MLLPIARFSKRLFWPTIILLGIAIVFIPIPVGDRIPTERYYRVEASRFAYEPSVLYVNPGDRVTIDLVSTDVVHGLAVDGYGIETIADPGQTARMSFIADRNGSFRMRCSATCGPMHPFMIGKIEVGRNELLWRGAALAVIAAFAGLWLTRR